MRTVAVVPIDDVIEHSDFAEDCVCGPTTEPVERDDGSFGWVLTHHSLDGRERDESDGSGGPHWLVEIEPT